MKTQTTRYILTCLLVLVLTACRADDPVEEVEEAYLPIYTEAEKSEDAYPISDEAYPVEELIFPVDESAYPITEADLAWLLQTWRLTSYAENGVDLAPPSKTLSFNTDGTYSMTTGSEQKMGTWTTILFAMESTLILNSETSATQYYQIIALDENELSLRTQIDNLQIDEGYLPAN